MTTQEDVCFFKNPSFNLDDGTTGTFTKPLIGQKLRAGGGGGKPPKVPRYNGDNNNNNNTGGHPHYVSGGYPLNWKGKALLAFATASMFLGLHKAANVAHNSKEFKENIITAAKQYPTDQRFNYYKP